jgi:hypothetical protein
MRANRVFAPLLNMRNVTADADAKYTGRRFP